MLKTLRNLFRFDASSEDHQPDLFEYAARSETSQDAATLPAKQQTAWKRRLPIGIALIFSLASGLILGYFLFSKKGASINRRGRIHSYAGEKIEADLLYLFNGKLYYRKDEKRNFVRMQDTARIDFEKPIEKKEETDKSTDIPNDLRRFIGSYHAVVGGHKARFTIYWNARAGRPGATIRFLSWGRRATEYLYAVSVRASAITFTRACSGSECRRIGSPDRLRQRFKGILSNDGRKIVGSYTGSKSGGRWIAIRN